MEWNGMVATWPAILALSRLRADQILEPRVRMQPTLRHPQMRVLRAPCHSTCEKRTLGGASSTAVLWTTRPPTRPNTATLATSVAVGNEAIGNQCGRGE